MFMGVILASRGWNPETQLNILQCTDGPHKMNHTAPNVSSTSEILIFIDKHNS